MKNYSVEVANARKEMGLVPLPMPERGPSSSASFASAKPRIVLDAKEILLSSFVLPWQNKTTYAQALLAPFALILAVDLLAELYEQLELSWVYLAVTCILYTVFAVTCHRLVLLPTAASMRFHFSWSWRETHFLLRVLTMLLASALLTLAATLLIAIVGAGLIMIIFGGMGTQEQVYPLYGFMVFCLFTYFSTRFSPLFPSAAIDHRENLKWAWGLTRNNGFSLTIAVGLPIIATFGIEMLLSDYSNIYVNLALTVLNTILMIFETTAISLAYKQLMQETN